MVIWKVEVLSLPLTSKRASGSVVPMPVLVPSNQRVLLPVIVSESDQ